MLTSSLLRVERIINRPRTTIITAPRRTVYFTPFLYLSNSDNREDVKKPRRRKGMVKPREYKRRYKLPLREVDAIINTDESIGPIQGVQEKEKEKPNKKERKGPFALEVSTFILFSLFAPNLVPYVKSW